ncbi:MAG: EAL domain-containing protein [Saccharospirillaceae bacterium]|nr:EAL domain-containing protein [Pseudomonadales bacterium]NRB78162.1 EAL domain-containing protein [Saccharospirillaceae bacterium]
MKSSILNILLIEDDEDDYIIFKEYLHEAVPNQFVLNWVNSVDFAIDEIDKTHFDFFFIDNRLGAGSGLDVISYIVKNIITPAPIVMLTGIDDRDLDLKAIELGADDYLVKSALNTTLLERTIRYCLRHKSLESKLVKQANYDSLTGLPNRQLFNYSLEELIKQHDRSKKRFCLLLLDLDFFKEVNDNYGHATGDLLLVKTASRIRHAVRKTDTVTRLGGDEFGILLRDITDVEQAINISNKIIDQFNTEFKLENKDIDMTTSIGIAFFPDDADNGLDLFKNSDLALYKAKSQGRNTFFFFNELLLKQSKQRMLVQHNLKTALLEKEFELFYQPIVDRNNQSLFCVEALIRWHHKKQTWIQPDDFIGIAEQTELIHALGNWIIQTAFKQQKKWTDQGLGNIKIAINTSAKQFQNPGFYHFVEEQLKIYQINPINIEFEITERLMLKDSVKVIDLINKFSHLGIKFSIDDFGTGYSALSYLKTLPIDIIKIDRSLINEIIHSKKDRAICSAIVTIGAALDMDIIAEGVETQEQQAVLSELNVNLIQGFLHAKAMPVDEFNIWYTNWVSGKNLHIQKPINNLNNLQ